MFSIKIEGAQKVERALRRLDKDVDKEANFFVKDVAAAGCRGLAMNTQPYGLAGKAKKTQEKAVYRDVSKVYSFVSRTIKRIQEKSPRMAAAFAKAVEDGKFSVAEKIARKQLGHQYEVGTFDDGRAHEAARNNRGKVVGVREKHSVIQQGVTSEYRKEKSEKAGFAKAGWALAGIALGAKTRFQKWLTRHNAPFRIQKRRGGKEIIVTNRVHYVSNILRVSQIRRVSRNAVRGVIKRYEKTVAAKAKKF